MRICIKECFSLKKKCVFFCVKTTWFHLIMLCRLQSFDKLKSSAFKVNCTLFHTKKKCLLRISITIKHESRNGAYFCFSLIYFQNANFSWKNIGFLLLLLLSRKRVRRIVVRCMCLDRLSRFSLWHFSWNGVHMQSDQRAFSIFNCLGGPFCQNQRFYYSV